MLEVIDPCRSARTSHAAVRFEEPLDSHGRNKLRSKEFVLQAHAMFQSLDVGQTGLVTKERAHRLTQRTASIEAWDGITIEEEAGIDFPTFLRIWTKGMVQNPAPHENEGALASLCIFLQRHFPVRMEYGFSRNLQWTFTAILTFLFSWSSYHTFEDWSLITHLPYDVSTCWLVGSLLGRVCSEAVATFPWLSPHRTRVLSQLGLTLFVCSINTCFARLVFNLSGHLCNGMYAIVITSTSCDFPLLERCLAWSALAVAIAVRQFGHLDCPWIQERHRRNCELEDSSQTRLPLVFGTIEALIHLIIVIRYADPGPQQRSLARALSGGEASSPRHWMSRRLPTRFMQSPTKSEALDQANSLASVHDYA